jgi:carboxyl-terminal processing protease
LFVGALLALAGCRREEPPPDRLLQPFPERYAGVGLELKVAEGWPEIVRVMPGTAAAAAGLRPGDAIVEIEGISSQGWELAEVVAALRGESQRRVIVSIRREGAPKEIVPLRRGLLVRRAALDAGVDGRAYEPVP